MVHAISGINTVPESVNSAVAQYTMASSHATAAFSSLVGSNPLQSTGMGVAQSNSAATSKYNIFISTLVTASISFLFIF